METSSTSTHKTCKIDNCGQPVAYNGRCKDHHAEHNRAYRREKLLKEKLEHHPEAEVVEVSMEEAGYPAIKMRAGPGYTPKEARDAAILFFHYVCKDEFQILDLYGDVLFNRLKKCAIDTLMEVKERIASGGATDQERMWRYNEEFVKKLEKNKSQFSYCYEDGAKRMVIWLPDQPMPQIPPPPSPPEVEIVNKEEVEAADAIINPPPTP